MDWNEIVRHVLPLTLRTVTLWATVLFAIRWTGKRTVTALAPFDLALVIMISEVASIPIADLEVDLLHGLLPVVLLGAMHVGLTTINLRFRKVEHFTQGKPTLLVANGRIIMRNLQQERVSLEDLATSLRQQQVSNLDDVEELWLEPTGGVSVILKPQARPLTLKDLQDGGVAAVSLAKAHEQMQRMLGPDPDRAMVEAPRQGMVPGMEPYLQQATGERNQQGERGTPH